MCSLFLAFLCLAAAAAHERNVQKYRGCFHAYYENPVAGKSMNALIQNLKQNQEAQGNRAAAWQEEAMVFENPAIGRMAEGTCIRVMGEQALAFGEGLCAGSYPLTEDETGCLISRTLAQELFGAEKVIGESLYIKGKSYKIRGMLDMETCAAALAGDETLSYTEAVVHTGDIYAPASAVQQELREKTGCAPDAFLEGGLYGALARIAVMTPVWLGWLLFAVSVSGVFKKKRQAKAVWYAAQCLIAAVILAGVWKLAGWTLTFSEDYLPAMWSDFSFWRLLIQEKTGDFMRLMNQTCSAQDRRMFRELRLSVYFAAGACVCLLSAYRERAWVSGVARSLQRREFFRTERRRNV